MSTTYFSTLARGDRLARFRKACPPQFMAKIEPHRLSNPSQFATVAAWKGTFPGFCCLGPTGGGKTRAVWSALGRLCVEEGRTFTWFTAKRLSEVYFEYHMDGEPERFWIDQSRFEILFLDDIDKIEQNSRNDTLLWEFADWIYRDKRPCISTTNQDRDWWTRRMGESFIRRFMDEAQVEVKF